MEYPTEFPLGFLKGLQGYRDSGLYQGCFETSPHLIVMSCSLSAHDLSKRTHEDESSVE